MRGRGCPTNARRGARHLGSRYPEGWFLSGHRWEGFPGSGGLRGVLTSLSPRPTLIQAYLQGPHCHMRPRPRILGEQAREAVCRAPRTRTSLVALARPRPSVLCALGLCSVLLFLPLLGVFKVPPRPTPTPRVSPVLGEPGERLALPAAVTTLT